MRRQMRCQAESQLNKREGKEDAFVGSSSRIFPERACRLYRMHYVDVPKSLEWPEG